MSLRGGVAEEANILILNKFFVRLIFIAIFVIGLRNTQSF